MSSKRFEVVYITTGIRETPWIAFIALRHCLPPIRGILKSKKMKSGETPSLDKILSACSPSSTWKNLISNALKFTSADRIPEIIIDSNQLTQDESIEYGLTTEKKIYYKIVIKDNGIGFRQEYAQQVFIIFQRLHEKNKYSGTGIGLALCEKIVQAHGGIIYAESEERKGAQFIIVLPELQK